MTVAFLPKRVLSLALRFPGVERLRGVPGAADVSSSAPGTWPSTRPHRPTPLLAHRHGPAGLHTPPPDHAPHGGAPAGHHGRGSALLSPGK